MQLDLFNLLEITGVFLWVLLFLFLVLFFFLKCQTNLKLILLKESEIEGSNKSIAIEEWMDLSS